MRYENDESVWQSKNDHTCKRKLKLEVSGIKRCSIARRKE